MKGMFRVFLAIAMIIVVGMFLLLSQKPMVFSQFESQEIVIKLFEETQATNIVSAVYLSARLYDTVFEFMVFAVAAGGVAFYSRFLGKATQFACLSDPAVAITLKLLALFAFLSGVYLAIFGHLAREEVLLLVLPAVPHCFFWPSSAGFPRWKSKSPPSTEVTFWNRGWSQHSYP